MAKELNRIFLEDSVSDESDFESFHDGEIEDVTCRSTLLY